MPRCKHFNDTNACTICERTGIDVYRMEWLGAVHTTLDVTRYTELLQAATEGGTGHIRTAQGVRVYGRFYEHESGPFFVRLAEPYK